MAATAAPSATTPRSITMQDVQRQFGRQAAHYSVSASHASGESLDAVRRMVEPGGYDRGLDIATGTGFTAFAIAPYCRETLALDLTPQMLNEARRLADERGLNDGRLGYLLGDAERLPFADGSLDLITCRVSAHHFPHVERFVAEVARSLRPGGVFVLSDTVAPEDDELAAEMDRVETLRDPSHVHDLRPSEWRRLIEEAGLTVDTLEMTHTYLEFDDWTRRSGTSAAAIEELRPFFFQPSPRAREAFGIHAEPDGVHFAWDNAGIRAHK
jgi:ubiquinone/menaquinone biosynthesis C-methylase UbiE